VDSAGAAPNLEQSRAVRSNRGDVGRDTSEEGPEQEPVAERVVEGGIADEDPARYLLAHRAASVPPDQDHAAHGDGSEQGHECSRPRGHDAFEDGRAKKWSPLWSSTCASSPIGSFPPCARRGSVGMGTR
jgi:hypothetical protein